MSATLLPPIRHRDRPTGPGAATPAGPDGAPPRRGPRRRSLAALLAATTLLGGAASTGLLAATGRLDVGGTTTSIALTATPAAADDASAGLDASALYTRASAGVVDISATGVPPDVPHPFREGGAAAASTGSGFVVDEQGHIVTAAHVVAGASGITVTFADGTGRGATVTGIDDATDVAVLRVDPEGLESQPLELGNHASLEVGDEVAAIGSPFGYERSITTGIVSGLDRSIEAPNGFTVAHAIQTDAALNPGNSGGPILDASGRVVGMADQIATGGSDQSAGAGFAVPIDLIADALDELKAGEPVRHAYLGVSTADAPASGGAAVATVARGGPAAAAGLRAGDVITAIEGAAATGSSDVVAAVADREPGDELALTVRRGAQTLEVAATLDDQPASARG